MLHVIAVPPVVSGNRSTVSFNHTKSRGIWLYTIDATGASLTVIVRIDIAPPPVLFAQTMCDVSDCSSVGVPEILPVEALRCNPSGKGGSTSNDVGSPPM